MTITLSPIPIQVIFLPELGCGNNNERQTKDDYRGSDHVSCFDYLNCDQEVGYKVGEEAKIRRVLEGTEEREAGFERDAGGWYVDGKVSGLCAEDYEGSKADAMFLEVKEKELLCQE